VAHEIDFQVFEPEHGDLFGGVAAGDGAHAGLQFGKRKGLGQVVIGAGVEAAHPIFDRVARRQQKDGGAVAQAAQVAHDLETIAAGKHDVEDHQLVGIGLSEEESLFAGGRNTHRMLLGLEALFDGLREFGLILDDKNPHESTVKPRRLTFASETSQKKVSSPGARVGLRVEIMLSPGPAQKVIIHLNEDASTAHDFLHRDILNLLLERGVAGASVIRPSAGFGSHHQLHTTGGGSVDGEHLPVRIEFLESIEAVERLLPELCELVNDGVVETHPTTIVKAARGVDRV